MEDNAYGEPPMPYADPEKQRERQREIMRQKREAERGTVREQTCAHCGTTFVPKRYVQGRAQYCSPSCRACASQKRRLDEIREHRAELRRQERVVAQMDAAGQ